MLWALRRCRARWRRGTWAGCMCRWSTGLDGKRTCASGLSPQRAGPLLAGESNVLPQPSKRRKTASSGHGRLRHDMPMRTFLLVSLAFLAVACPLTPPSPASPKPVQGQALATPALAEPAPAETPPSPPASTTAGAASEPCPSLSHAAQAPAWTGTPLHAAIYARDVQQVRQLAVEPALHELDTFEATPLLAALSPSVDEPAAPPPRPQRHGKPKTPCNSTSSASC